MKTRFTMTVLVIMVAIAGSLYTKAQAGPHGFGAPMVAAEDADSRHQNRLEAMAAVLELTDEQRSQIQQILTAEKQRNEPLREELRQGREAMRLATEGGVFDEDRVRTLATEQAQARVEMAVAHARMKNRIFALLTPEQQSLAKKLHPLMGKGRGKCKDF